MENSVINAVYIHIPFCTNICSYCDFCKMYHNKKWVNIYLESLKKEIDDRFSGGLIKTLYIGGGSPSSLSNEELKKLFDILKVFKFMDNYEFTFECNLNDINEDLLRILYNGRVNRLSIGIESFDKKNLKLLYRKSNYKDAKYKINLCKKYFNNINVDLMYAIYGESLEVLKKDLKQMVSLNINHISTYSLMIEKNTVLGNLNIKPISEDEDARMYNYICKYLKRHHFIHYEVSNFALKGYESRHNLVYWNNKEYYGFGLGASGYIDKIRYDNTKNLRKYINEEYVANKEILSLKDIMDYEIILGLRKCNGINVKRFYQKYHVDLFEEYDIQKQIDNKNIIYKKGKIFINPDKLYIMNEILTQIV